MRLTHLFSAAALACTVALPASALDLTNMSDEERAMFHEEVRAYLMDQLNLILRLLMNKKLAH